jgi:ubiquinone/menaquinone biosynthesis C-methylase UbiE
MKKAGIPDQIIVWDSKHLKGDHNKLRGVPSPFSLIAEPMFKRKSTILELGCGVGRDAIFFSENGHKVVATDGSNVVISENKKRLNDTGIEFDVLNMLKKFPFSSSTFDTVYSNLSLHYYTYKATPKIIKEVHRVLKTGGVFAFSCKSKDGHFNNGTKIDENIYVNANNHAIHFFDKSYVTKLLSGLFLIEYLDEVEEDYEGRFSKIVRCIAKKR